MESYRSGWISYYDVEKTKIAKSTQRKNTAKCGGMWEVMSHHGSGRLDLNMKCPHRLMCLNSCSLDGGTLPGENRTFGSCYLARTRESLRLDLEIMV